MKRIFGFTVVGSVSVLCIWYYLLTRPSVHSRVPFSQQLIAEYDGFAFVTVREDMYRFVTGLIQEGPRLPVAQIFVRDRQHGIHLLPDLTEELGGKIVLDAGWQPDPPSDDTQVFYHAGSMLKFQNRKLIHANLLADSNPFELAPSRDGPFVRLPISRQKMLDVFGKPKRWYFGNRVGGP